MRIAGIDSLLCVIYITYNKRADIHRNAHRVDKSLNKSTAEDVSRLVAVVTGGQ